MSTGTPAALACDYLDAPAPASAVAGAGYIAALRYLRNLTMADVIEAHAAGLGIGLIFETTAQRAALGGPAGSADGTNAGNQALSLGAPPGAVVYVNVGDWAVAPDQLGNVTAYYRAFGSALGQVGGYHEGGYGTAYVIEALAGAGCSGPWWQNAMDDQGVPGDVVLGLSSLYQRVTPTLTIAGAAPGSWDEDVILQPVPWWTGTPVPPVPAPTPPPVHTFPTGATVKTIPLVPGVEIKTGKGWAALPVPAAKVFSVVIHDENPDETGQFDAVPSSWAVASQPGPNSPNGALVLGGGSDGIWGVDLWVVT